MTYVAKWKKQHKYIKEGNYTASNQNRAWNELLSQMTQGEAFAHFLIWLEILSEKGARVQMGGHLISLYMEHHAASGIRGAHYSSAMVKMMSATCEAIKLPLIIHQVLRVHQSTFRASAWHFPLMVALANVLTEFRWLHQATQLYYIRSDE